jgi:hypothetical protein
MSRMSELYGAINELMFELEDGSIDLDTAIDSIVDNFGSAMGIEFVYDQFMSVLDDQLA